MREIVVVNGTPFVPNYQLLCPNCGHSPVLQHTLSRSEKLNRISVRLLCPKCKYTWTDRDFIIYPEWKRW